MPQLDPATFAPQLVWLTICFIALYLVISRVALPRIGSVIQERQDRMAADLTEAKWLKEKTDAAIAAYEQALADARGKAHGIASQTRGELTSRLAGEKAAAEQETSAKTASAEAAIQQIRQKSLAEVERIAAETTEALVEKLIGTKADAAAAKAAVAKLAREPGASIQAG